MSDNAPDERRKLNPGEMSGDDAATRPLPSEGAAASSSGPARRTTGAHPRRNTPPTGSPRRDAGTVGPRPAASNGNPAKAGNQQRASSAALIPPHLRQAGATPVATPRPTLAAVPPHRRFTWKRLIAVLAILLLVTTGAVYWWVQARVNHVSEVIVVSPPERPHVDPVGNLIPTPMPGEPTFTPPPPLPDWTSHPFTVLLMGVDTRQKSPEICKGNTPTPDTPKVYPRSDVLILVRVDPVNHKVNMLSIPRDLWVKIPGQDGEHKINAGYEFGVSHNLPGGGPGLETVTIEQNFGVKVNYYAVINFQGFQKLVDAVGGVDTDVPYPQVDDQYPTECYGEERIMVPAGVQHMDGATALKYARSRHLDSDLGRNQRQQRVLLAIKERALRFQSASDADKIIESLRGTISTDFTLSKDPLALLNLALNTKNGDIKQQGISLDSGMITQGVSEDGQDILVPQWEKIRPMITSLFDVDPIWAEGATVRVLNGTETAGLATRTQKFLQQRGFDAGSVGNEEQRAAKTRIINYGNKPNTSSQLARDLGLDPNQDVTGGRGGPEGVDIVVILGADMENKPWNVVTPTPPTRD